MKNIDVLRELFMAMDDLSPRNEALRYGIIAVLDKIQGVEPKPEPEKKEAKRGRPAGSTTKREPFNTGKAKACRDAGWSIAKIADEMRVSEQTVRNHLAKA